MLITEHKSDGEYIQYTYLFCSLDRCLVFSWFSVMSLTHFKFYLKNKQNEEAAQCSTTARSVLECIELQIYCTTRFVHRIRHHC